jgi:hypothetical protein
MPLGNKEENRFLKKKEAINRNDWKTRFGLEVGHFARQTTA